MSGMDTESDSDAAAAEARRILEEDQKKFCFLPSFPAEKRAPSPSLIPRRRYSGKECPTPYFARGPAQTGDGLVVESSGCCVAENHNVVIVDRDRDFGGVRWRVMVLLIPKNVDMTERLLVPKR